MSFAFSGALYPVDSAARDRFVLDRRGPRPRHDPWRYQNVIVEDERSASGQIARGATVLLTGRECPWRCVMCDLWQYTIEGDTPGGAIPRQLVAAKAVLRRRGEPITQVKLYNAGSFFDPRAVPEADYQCVATHLTGLSRVIVESHPALVGIRVGRFLDALETHARDGSTAPRLEVAMGLETAHAEALGRLQKGMSLADFERASRRLTRQDVAIRAFLLISPPFVPVEEQDEWLVRSMETAFACGASAVSLIPTRAGNGALDALAGQGLARLPNLEDVERSADLAQAHRPERGRVFVDLWDLERLSGCPRCFTSRRTRLHAMNLEQRAAAVIECDCESSGHAR